MWTKLNDTLKGWRGILLAWTLTALTYAESVYQFMAVLMVRNDPLVAAGGWKYAAIIAIGVTAKNILTDVSKR